MLLDRDVIHLLRGNATLGHLLHLSRRKSRRHLVPPVPRRSPQNKWFKDAGFVNIHVEKFVVPYGVWPKDPRPSFMSRFPTL
ncbi:hypothetical protein VTN31DRAFT_2804 [Thermomyces dupontii]|uniref:uncharacterized protein n=1 Tax=Talaromyces thermophilus TaxID=28565 RepID=UPI0037429779